MEQALPVLDGYPTVRMLATVTPGKDRVQVRSKISLVDATGERKRAREEANRRALRRVSALPFWGTFPCSDGFSQDNQSR